MKKSLIFVHGGDSYTRDEDFLEALQCQNLYDPQGKQRNKFWSHDLHDQLEHTYEVFTPTMPNKANACYEEWKIWFERHLALTEGEVVLVGWSLGAMFLAKYLIEEQLDHAVSALFLIAGPCGTYNDGSGNDCGSFRFEPSLIPTMREKVPNVEVWHSKDDFVVPYEHALKFKELLPSAELVTFSDRNHFLQNEFPELIQKLKEFA
ncbi:alpha/beta hydrolase [Candidatus Pacebacteria bacterium]|nr:alpha/beta hydrolase [Candidatus Paceibacterota bacterium]